MREPIEELLLAGDKELNTRSPLYPLAEWLEPCGKCGAAKGEPCVPQGGSGRQERARHNHASHIDRRRAAAERLSGLLATAIMSEAGKPGAYWRRRRTGDPVQLTALKRRGTRSRSIA
jgi:hypothetical protein